MGDFFISSNVSSVLDACFEPFTEDALKLRQKLDDVLSLCNQLYTSYTNLQKNATFDQILRLSHTGSDIYDGIRLEASRAIISAEEGGGFVGGLVRRQFMKSIQYY